MGKPYPASGLIVINCYSSSKCTIRITVNENFTSQRIGTGFGRWYRFLLFPVLFPELGSKAGGTGEFIFLPRKL